MKRLALLALLVLACLAVTSSASATVTCNDQGFISQKLASTRQLNTALSYMGLESHASAAAWALRSWRTLQATSPCQPTYRRWRQYELNSSAAIWNAAKAYRSGNLSGALKLLDQASRWTDKAGAEEANWG